MADLTNQPKIFVQSINCVSGQTINKPPCLVNATDISRVLRETEIVLGSIFDEPSPIGCIDGGWETVTELVYANASQKNDAVTVPQDGVWKNSDMQNYFSTRSKGNYYYSDTGTKGGYNHMEMRRFRYAYSDPSNGVSKNAKVLPLKEAEEWIRLILTDN